MISGIIKIDKNILIVIEDVLELLDGGLFEVIEFCSCGRYIIHDTLDLVSKCCVYKVHQGDTVSLLDGHIETISNIHLLLNEANYTLLSVLDLKIPMRPNKGLIFRQNLPTIDPISKLRAHIQKYLIFLMIQFILTRQQNNQCRLILIEEDSLVDFVGFEGRDRIFYILFYPAVEGDTFQLSCVLMGIVFMDDGNAIGL